MLEKVVTLQSSLKDAGSVMFSEQKAYTAITDTIKLSGIKGPERYITSPDSPEGQQASQQKQQQQQEEKQKADQMQIAMARAQLMLAQAEKMKADAAMVSQQVKAKNDTLTQENNKLKTIIDAADKSDQTQFDYDKLASDAALHLTNLEAQYNKDFSQQNADNRV